MVHHLLPPKCDLSDCGIPQSTKFPTSELNGTVHLLTTFYITISNYCMMFVMSVGYFYVYILLIAYYLPVLFSICIYVIAFYSVVIVCN